MRNEHNSPPLLAAPTPEEWEPFLRTERPTDNNPIIFTERQLSRIQWITAAVLDRSSPDHEQALDEHLRALGLDPYGNPLGDP